MMTLDTTTFLILFTAAIVILGGFIVFKYQSEKKKER